MYLKVKTAAKERQNNSLVRCNSQLWARLKLGVRNSIWDSHMGGRNQSIWVIIRCQAH